MRMLLLCFCAWPLLAGEFAVLSNGFRVHADRHEKRGEVICLETQAGVTELPAGSVVGFEVEEYAAPVPLPPAAPSTAAAATVKAPKTPRQFIEDAAHQAELPPAIVHAVAKAESGYRTDAISPKGAIGMMQLMPATARDLQANPYDPEQNANAGARYLRDLLLKYNGNVALALAAYNAGPGAVDRYGDVPPYRETRSYVNRVISNYKKLGGE